MNGITRAPRFGVSRSVWVGLTWIGAAFLGIGAAQAAPIQKTSSAADAGLGQAWSEYLMGGPSVWAKVSYPPITTGVEAAIWQDLRTDPGATDPMVQFLLWKQSVDPARFDFYHPNLVPVLAKLASPTTAPQQITPPTTTTSPSSSPPAEGQQVPEPGSLVSTLGLVSWGIWWCWRGHSNVRLPRRR